MMIMNQKEVKSKNKSEAECTKSSSMVSMNEYKCFHGEKIEDLEANESDDDSNSFLFDKFHSISKYEVKSMKLVHLRQGGLSNEESNKIKISVNLPPNKSTTPFSLGQKLLMIMN